MSLGEYWKQKKMEHFDSGNRKISKYGTDGGELEKSS
jgi:hypothetical protein